MLNIFEVEMVVLIKGGNYEQSVEKLHKILKREYIQIVTIRENKPKPPTPKLTFDE
jgi:hypothetical protein